jgi:hypothetical protein
MKSYEKKYFFIILATGMFFLVVLCGISKAGQTIDLSYVIIDEATAGNGSLENYAEDPFQLI